MARHSAQPWHVQIPGLKSVNKNLDAKKNQTVHI